VNVLKVVIS
jgi:hypothetical protein